jgi:hypothetical protein
MRVHVALTCSRPDRLKDPGILADFWGGLGIIQLRQAAKVRHDFLPDR